MGWRWGGGGEGGNEVLGISIRTVWYGKVVVREGAMLGVGDVGVDG